MFKIRLSALLFVSLFSLVSCVHTPDTKNIPSPVAADTIYQVSTINALLAGDYQGAATIGEIKKHGDSGLGTYTALDGEMVVIDGVFYQIALNGDAQPVPVNFTSPYATVTFFEDDASYTVLNIESYDNLKQVISSSFISENIFYAVRIDGTFHYIKTRSVPRQEKPYQPLTEVIKQQQFREFNSIKGSIIGFWHPPFYKNITVPEFHFHFITENRTAGGHLLACEIENATVRIDYTTRFFVDLPTTDEYLSLDLITENKGGLDKVEKD